MGKKPDWQEWELEYLHDYYGRVSDETISKKLDRSVLGIRLKAQREGLTRTDTFFTAFTAGQILGVSASIVRHWIDTGALKAKKSAAVKAGTYQCWHIEPKDFEKFLVTRTDLYDYRRIGDDHLYYRNLAVKAAGKNHVKKGQHWQPWEDAILLNHRQKMTQAELAKKLNRTKEAVHARLVLLKAQGRLVTYKPVWERRARRAARPWTEADDNYLRENWRRPRRAGESGWGNHMTALEIAAHLDRTVYSCWSRAMRLGITNPDERKVA